VMLELCAPAHGTDITAPTTRDTDSAARTGRRHRSKVCLYNVSSHFAERAIVRSGDAARTPASRGRSGVWCS
jgi:hypothetical protein